MNYLALKHLHMSAIALSLLLFVLRYIWMLRDSPQLKAGWVRVLPHIVDTVLLISGVWLATFWYRNGAPMGWLGVKLIALLVYIVLGSIAIKRGHTRSQRMIAGLLALLVFAYIVAVALSKSPLLQF
jgi:uncharacterized membrane protein SirB2